MKVKIWVVQGSTGEYSDRHEWPVCAYISEELAREHTANAQAKADLLLKKYDYLEIPKGANEFDSDMDADYTGTSYSYYYQIAICQLIGSIGMDWLRETRQG